MPLSFQDATIQPIPKGSKDPSSSANYRGIAPLSVKSWSGPFFSPGSHSSLPVTYSLGLSQAFLPPSALVY